MTKIPAQCFHTETALLGVKARNTNGAHHQGTLGHSLGACHILGQPLSSSSPLRTLVPPKTNEIAATNGLAMLIFAMSFILMFVLWVLVAAIPCQDRGVQIHFAIPRQFSWSTPLFLLHSRIMDESKKREQRNTCGLLKEIYQIEKCVHQLTDSVDAAQFPLSDRLKDEVNENVNELSLACGAFKTGLEPLQCKLRETFRKVMACRSRVPWQGHTALVKLQCWPQTTVIKFYQYRDQDVLLIYMSQTASFSNSP
ncbi:protein ROH1-like [Salvia splendens]|uniref:protein ROH1-like n=1 Tax=Salvia splendens TaxID=180675 RepID=UPI001C257B51|nr:protein ROH1-like [Salvia splendens]